MNRLLELIQEELTLAGAVASYRPRSLVVLGIAAVTGPLFMLLTRAFVQTSALPGLEQALRPMIGLFALVLTFKFFFLAVRLYLKDRAALLKF